MARISRAHALVAAAALLGCGKQPEPVSAPAPSATEPSGQASSAAPIAASSASTEQSAVASAPPVAPSVAPPATATATASVVATAAPTPNSPPVSGLHFGAAAYGGPPGPVSGYDTPIVKGPKSVTNVASFDGGSDEAKTVVRKNVWRFKNCHNKALAQDPSTAGKMTVVVKVDAEGAVTDATVGSSSVTPYLTSCVLAGAKGMKFPKPAKAETLSFTLTFTTSD